jgi:hypothetical protein
MLARLLAQTQGLNAAGWVMLIGCVGMVCCLMVYCYWRILRVPRPPEHPRAPLEIDRRDTD